MKTITMSDEVYEFLKSCQEELKTQDNRSTANPIFGFREIMECSTADGYADDGVVFVHEGDVICKNDYSKDDNAYITPLINFIIEYISIEKILKFIEINDHNSEEDISNINENNFEDNIDEVKKKLIPIIEDTWSDLEDLDIDSVPFQRIHKMYESSISLFESDMKAHLDSNKHNMDDSTYTYVYSNWRTPKITKLRDVLLNDLNFEEI